METKEILIEWEFDECETKLASAGANSQLASMTVAEELNEIFKALCHPIGITVTQLIILGMLYDGIAWIAKQHVQLFDEKIVCTVLICSCAIFTVAVFVCCKYWKPKHLAWISTLLLALSAWVITEWSLFLD